MFFFQLEDFLRMGERQATDLKWKWLLERVRCRVRCSLTRQGRVFARIDDCRKLTSQELMDSTVVAV